MVSAREGVVLWLSCLHLFLFHLFITLLLNIFLLFAWFHLLCPVIKCLPFPSLSFFSFNTISSFSSPLVFISFPLLHVLFFCLLYWVILLNFAVLVKTNYLISDCLLYIVCCCFPVQNFHPFPNLITYIFFFTPVIHCLLFSLVFFLFLQHNSLYSSLLIILHYPHCHSILHFLHFFAVTAFLSPLVSFFSSFSYTVSLSFSL